MKKPKPASGLKPCPRGGGPMRVWFCDFDNGWIWDCDCCNRVKKTKRLAILAANKRAGGAKNAN